MPPKKKAAEGKALVNKGMNASNKKKETEKTVIVATTTTTTTYVEKKVKTKN
jgi:hypothetical protein